MCAILFSSDFNIRSMEQYVKYYATVKRLLREVLNCIAVFLML